MSSPAHDVPAASEVTTISTTRLPGVDVVTVTGDLDAFCEGRLRRAMSDPAHVTRPHVILDLTRATFLDARAVGAIVYCRRILAARDAALLLVCPDGPALRVLRLLGLERVLPIHPDQDTALRGIALGQGSTDPGAGGEAARSDEHPRDRRLHAIQ
jgi:anti-sigma B factor antagonist